MKSKSASFSDFVFIFSSFTNKCLERPMAQEVFRQGFNMAYALEAGIHEASVPGKTTTTHTQPVVRVRFVLMGAYLIPSTPPLN